MFRRMLLTTVAAVALTTAPALADEAAQQSTEQKLEQAGQQAGQTAETVEQKAEQVTEEVQQEAGQAAEKVEEGTEQAAEEVKEETEQAAEQVEAQPETEAPAVAEESEATEEEMAEETPPAGMKFIEVQDEAQFLANDEVIGKDVVNANDEEVGEISDLVMDQEQKLVGVIISVGGFLGLGEKKVGVPIDQIEFPTDDQPARLLVEVTEEQLKNAPDFVSKDVVQAQEAAQQAQQQQMQGQVPPPAATSQ